MILKDLPCSARARLVAKRPAPINTIFMLEIYFFEVNTIAKPIPIKAIGIMNVE